MSASSTTVAVVGVAVVVLETGVVGETCVVVASVTAGVDQSGVETAIVDSVAVVVEVETRFVFGFGAVVVAALLHSRPRPQWGPRWKGS